MQLTIMNIIITAICLIVLIFYFNHRERKMQKMADHKFSDIREKYLVQIAKRKARERAEIERLKAIVARLQHKHHEQILDQKGKQKIRLNMAQAEDLLKRAHTRAKEIEKEAREKSQKFIDDQKKEVQTKMIDLVIGVTKKVLTKGLSYDDQKALIEEAIAEVEGDKS